MLTLILLLAAVICFVAHAFNAKVTVNLFSLGWAFVVATLLVPLVR